MKTNTTKPALPVIMLDELVHTDEHPYCSDTTCPCQQDRTYEPNGSNYHDHLCTCPGCHPQPPDPTEDEVRMMNRCQSCETITPHDELKIHICPPRR